MQLILFGDSNEKRRLSFESIYDDDEAVMSKFQEMFLDSMIIVRLRELLVNYMCRKWMEYEINTWIEVIRVIGANG